MKKYHIKKVVALWLFILTSGSYTIANAQDYSVKNRWNTKIGYSRNQTYEIGFPFAWPDAWGDIPMITKRASNFRMELNYGVLNWLEVGVYGGFTHYNPYQFVMESDTLVNFTKTSAFAPTFGINVNFHLLPLFVKKEKCRWEWYITAKYGGACFTKWNNKDYTFLISPPDNLQDWQPKYNPNRYRHEYGIGMGAGVYFWNIFGLYIEVCGGQYSYFPEYYKAWHSIRGGIEFKFTPKPKKKLE